MNDDIAKAIQEELDTIEENEAKIAADRKAALEELTQSPQDMGLYNGTEGIKITLKGHDAKRFAQILLHPPPPNVRLIEAMQQTKLPLLRKFWITMNVWYWKVCFLVFRW